MSTDTINQVSRAITKALRHDAKFPKVDNGYATLDTIVSRFKLNDRIKQLPQFSNIQELLRHLVNTDNKSRFGVRCSDGTELSSNVTARHTITHLRANQGHSCNVSIELERLTPEMIGRHFVMIHGTTMDAWQKIKKDGLSKMTRDYIHFAKGLPGEVKSGMRQSSQVLIYIDAAKVMAANIPIYTSANGVLLCKGVNGVLSPCYFAKVEFR